MSKHKGSSTKKKQLQDSSEKQKPCTVTTAKLIQFFSKTAELERKLQIIKEMLCEEQEFSPASLFHRLDVSRKGYIVEQDIQNFLDGAKITYKGSQLKTLFGRINANKDSQAIYLREFQNFILPNQNPKLRYFTTRRPVFVPLPQQKLTEKIEWIVAKFFTEIIWQYTKLMDLNNSLVSSFDFNANNIFDILSLDGQTVTAEDIDNFMKQNLVELSREEIGCILRLIDKKGEGHLYLDDFKLYLATLGLKKEHEIFDELSPIPALKDFHENEVNFSVKDRNSTLKERYKDNKSYVKGMDEEGHHMLGYSRQLDNSLGNSQSWLSNSRKARR